MVSSYERLVVDDRLFLKHRKSLAKKRARLATTWGGRRSRYCHGEAGVINGVSSKIHDTPDLVNNNKPILQQQQIGRNIGHSHGFRSKMTTKESKTYSRELNESDVSCKIHNTPDPVNNNTPILQQQAIRSRFRPRMTREDQQTYSREVAESGGFDFSAVPGPFVHGRFRLFNLSIERRKWECEKVAEIAIAAFNDNKNLKETKGVLKLENLIKATYKCFCGILYYLTFDAIKLRNGRVKTYQAIVYLDPLQDDNVLAFRRKPENASPGSDTSQKDWYWKKSSFI